jgi:hypothetical protein
MWIRRGEPVYLYGRLYLLKCKRSDEEERGPSKRDLDWHQTTARDAQEARVIHWNPGHDQAVRDFFSLRSRKFELFSMDV